MKADNLRELATRTLLSRFADMCEGAVIVDADVRVVWMNDRYPRHLGLHDPATAIGQPIEQVIPNSLMRQVIESGRPIMLDIMDFGDKSFVVNRLPLHDENGAAALARHVGVQVQRQGQRWPGGQCARRAAGLHHPPLGQ